MASDLDPWASSLARWTSAGPGEENDGQEYQQTAGAVRQKPHTVEPLPGEDTLQSHWKEVTAHGQTLQDAP